MQNATVILNDLSGREITKATGIYDYAAILNGENLSVDWYVLQLIENNKVIIIKMATVLDLNSNRLLHLTGIYDFVMNMKAVKFYKKRKAGLQSNAYLYMVMVLLWV